MLDYLGYTAFYSEQTEMLEKMDATIVSLVEDYKPNHWSIPTIIDGNRSIITR